MSPISFAPLAEPLEFVPGDTVPPITIPVQDENGVPIAVGAYDLTTEIIGADGARTPASGSASNGSVVFWMTPEQSAQATEGSRWCVQLATPDLSDVRTIALGPCNLTLK